MSELGTCSKYREPHSLALHRAEIHLATWRPLPAKQPIPPLVLQAYRALTSRPLTTGETIAAIEAEYPGVKEKA